MKRKLFLVAATAAVLLGSFALVQPACAEKWADVGPDGKDHVYHTRAAPVVVHKVFPPYTGIHKYVRHVR